MFVQSDGSDDAGPDRVATAQQIARDLRARDGVTAVGAVRRLPVLGNGWTSFFSSEGGEGESFESVQREADAGYFEAMQATTQSEIVSAMSMTPIVVGSPTKR